MDEFTAIIKIVESLATLFGPTFTAVIIIFFIYTRHFKRGNILVIKGNNKNKTENEKENKEKFAQLPYCEERLRACMSKFSEIESQVAEVTHKFSDLDKISRETHTNVAILLERTEILKISQKKGK